MENKRPEQLDEYHEIVHYGLMAGEGPGLSQIREELALLPLSSAEAREIAELDAGALYEILHNEGMQDYVLIEDSTQPLSRWWWHLGNLHAGVYPAELLPEYLQAIYRQPASVRMRAWAE